MHAVARLGGAIVLTAALMLVAALSAGLPLPTSAPADSIAAV